jgi:hypothetical protein
MEGIQRARLMCDVGKWTAARLAPKRYGDRLIQEHVGANNGPIQHEDVTTFGRDAFESKFIEIAASSRQSPSASRSRAS